MLQRQLNVFAQVRRHGDLWPHDHGATLLRCQLASSLLWHHVIPNSNGWFSRQTFRSNDVVVTLTLGQVAADSRPRAQTVQVWRALRRHQLNRSRRRTPESRMPTNNQFLRPIVNRRSSFSVRCCQSGRPHPPRGNTFNSSHWFSALADRFGQDYWVTRDRCSFFLKKPIVKITHDRNRTPIGEAQGDLLTEIKNADLSM